jgi:hypothetical protein
LFVSQLLSCLGHQSLFIAADRRVEQQEAETAVHFERKLFRLGPNAVVATSGAAVGIEVSRRLSQGVTQGLSLGFSELEKYVLAVFQREYEDFTKRGADWFAENPEAHRLSYIMFGGRTEQGGFEVRFYASEDHDSPYQPVPIGAVLSAPRRLGLEMSMMAAVNGEASSNELRELATTGLTKVAERDEKVGGGFDCALFERGGVELFSIDPS